MMPFEGIVMDANRPDRFIRLKSVLTLVGLSKSSIYSMMNAGMFPLPYKLQSRAVAWLESEIQSWILSRTGDTK
jgi:prophage regulatory protein